MTFDFTGTYSIEFEHGDFIFDIEVTLDAKGGYENHVIERVYQITRDEYVTGNGIDWDEHLRNNECFDMIEDSARTFAQVYA